MSWTEADGSCVCYESFKFDQAAHCCWSLRGSVAASRESSVVTKSLSHGVTAPELCHFGASLAYGARGMASRSPLSEWRLKDVAILLVHTLVDPTFLQVLLLPNTEAVLSGVVGTLRLLEGFAEQPYAVRRLTRGVLPGALRAKSSVPVARC